MVERRLTALIAASITLMALAILWNVFMRHRVPVAAPVRPPVSAVPDTATHTAPDTATSRPQPPVTTTTSQGVGADTGGLSYMDALARSETRRRVRASAGVTYLNEIVAASQDSMLHRWDNRGRNPVRVYVTPGTVANFQPGFVDAIRGAFAEWGTTGVPVRFALGGASRNHLVPGARRAGRRRGVARPGARCAGSGRGADRNPPGRRGALLRVRPPLPRQAGPAGDLQGPLQQGRRPARPRGLCRRLAVRPHREETLLPLPPGQRYAHLRDAGLRLSLRLLPELADLSGPARRDGRRAADRHHARPGGAARPPPGRPHGRLVVQRAAHYGRVGGRGVQDGAGGRSQDRVHLQRQCHAPGARLHPAVDRLLQDRLEGDGRPALPRAWRRAAARARRGPPGPRARVLAGDRDAHRPRLQRR